MRTPWIWSVSLGRWWNVHVRLHLFFFFFATFVVYITSLTFDEPNWLGAVCPVVLFLSVLLHEIGHVIVARKLGGVADEIVISPLGGLSPVRVPYEPHSELVAIMAGTLVNATICFSCALALLLIQGNDAALVELLPITASYFTAADSLTWVSLIRLVFWLNWSLILVNLIPAFPFDGGRSLHAVLGFLWPELESKQSLITICRLGKIISVLLLLCACYKFEAAPTGTPQPPAWVALALLSIYVFFCARREELQQAESEHDDDKVFGYDFSQGYTSLERSLAEEADEEPEERPKPVSPFSFIHRWLEKRREAEEQRLVDQEREDEKRVDEILSRLHEGGMHALSPEDKALLDRVSQRYRSRPTSSSE